MLERCQVQLKIVNKPNNHNPFQIMLEKVKVSKADEIWLSIE
jgi:hypothetical protein